MAIISFPNLNSSVVNKEGKFIPVWIRFFQDLWRRVGGQRDLKLGGVLSNDIEEVGTTAGTGTDDLMTYTLAANSLNTTGDYLEIIAFGTLASNNNSKTISLNFGSQAIYTTNANNANGGAWYFKALIFRDSSSTQKIIVTIHSSSNQLQNDDPYSANYTAGTQDLTASQIIKCTGGGLSEDDIIQQAMIIKYYSNS